MGRPAPGTYLMPGTSANWKPRAVQIVWHACISLQRVDAEILGRFDGLDYLNDFLRVEAALQVLDVPDGEVPVCEFFGSCEGVPWYPFVWDYLEGFFGWPKLFWPEQASDVFGEVVYLLKGASTVVDHVRVESQEASSTQEHPRLGYPKNSNSWWLGKRGITAASPAS